MSWEKWRAHTFFIFHQNNVRDYPEYILLRLRASALERKNFALRVQFLQKSTDFLLLLLCTAALLNLFPRSTEERLRGVFLNNELFRSSRGLWGGSAQSSGRHGGCLSCHRVKAGA